MLNLTYSHLPLLMRSRTIHRLILFSLFIVLLASCAAPPTTPTTPAGVGEAGVEYIAELEQKAADGQFLDAALAYSKLSTASQPPLSQHYSLRAAELLMDGNYVPQSYQLMNEIDSNTLTPELKIRMGLLAAQIAIARQLPEEALSREDSIQNPSP
ncbi:penicillin-binding protein activator, partial [Kaarinaea lacus]